MIDQRFMGLPNIFDGKDIVKNNNKLLKQLFKGKIRGNFLINIKNRVLEQLGIEGFLKYYDIRWSNKSMITGISEAPEYDICRMIVGIHRAYSIFLSDDEIRKNEENGNYQQKVISETIEKIRLRPFGSIFFKKSSLFPGEEFLYYPLPYELFSMSVKISKALYDDEKIYNWQLYYGMIQNSFSALNLMEDNLFGGAYSLCRGAIELYLKFLVLSSQKKSYEWYEKFRIFEIEQSCSRTYPEAFNSLFQERMQYNSKKKADYLHYGWVDFVEDYHDIVKKSPYSVYGMIAFLRCRGEGGNWELEQLERFYQSCHAYTHGSIQNARYPVLHYFEISMMLYHIIRGTFLKLYEEKHLEPIIEKMDIISMIDRDFKIMHEQYKIRSTEKFENYYGEN